MLADARHLTTWHARCLLRRCRADGAGADGTAPGPVEGWAAEHAHGRTGHVVAVWCCLAGQLKFRPMMLRYSDVMEPVNDWLMWGWVCLDRHPGLSRPRWIDGLMTAKAALADWREHECTGRTDR